MGSIVVRDMNLRYGDVVVFDNLNQSIYDGECFVILGKSGSGKTSFLKAVSGLFPPPSGQIIIDGENICEYSKQEMLNYHQRSGFVFEKSALINNLSIYENLALFYHYHYPTLTEADIHRKTDHFINRLGLSDDLNLRPNSLSMGEQRMISIVRAVSHDPDYIFWDEPLVNLDHLTRSNVIEIIKELKTEGRKTMIVVTHNLEFIREVGDRIGILHQGKIIESGSWSELSRSELTITRNLIGIT